MKALVIEDRVTSALLVCSLLEKNGLESLHSRSGEEALAIFRQHRPDIIFLNTVMPDLSGFEIARRIRQLESDGEWTPLIFLTDRATESDLERAIEVGGDDYLVKPVSEVVLRAKVHAFSRITQMRSSLLLLTRKLNEANHQLARLSALDGLTGIANRRAFDEYFHREWRRSRRQQSTLALLLVDVDYFKCFNDRYGHQAGDECLREIAAALRAHMRRSSDVVARYGGEEFAVVLPETDETGARQVADSLLSAVRSLGIAHEASAVSEQVTISIGAAVMVPVREAIDAWDVLLEAADQALYRAKHAGRNRLVCEVINAPPPAQND